MAIKPIPKTYYSDSSSLLEVPTRPKRSISFSKDSPQVFEYSTLHLEENSQEDSITPTFSQTSNFSLVVSDLTTKFNKIKTLNPTSLDMNHIPTYTEIKINDHKVKNFDSNIKLSKPNKSRLNCSGDQPELDEFFCMSTDKSQSISASCGCIMF